MFAVTAIVPGSSAQVELPGGTFVTVTNLDRHTREHLRIAVHHGSGEYPPVQFDVGWDYTIHDIGATLLHEVPWWDMANYLWRINAVQRVGAAVGAVRFSFEQPAVV